MLDIAYIVIITTRANALDDECIDRLDGRKGGRHLQVCVKRSVLDNRSRRVSRLKIDRYIPRLEKEDEAAYLSRTVSAGSARSDT